MCMHHTLIDSPIAGWSTSCTLTFSFTRQLRTPHRNKCWPMQVGMSHNVYERMMAYHAQVSRKKSARNGVMSAFSASKWALCVTSRPTATVPYKAKNV